MEQKNQVEAKKNIKVLIADDHTIVRQALVQALNQESRIQVVADVRNGQEAVEMATSCCPDVIIMDINMPDLNGIEATRRICSTSPGIRIIGLSIHQDDLYVIQMLRAGASGFVLKSCSFTELTKAIHEVYAGKVYLCSEVTGCVIDSVRNPENQPVSDDIWKLTGRDREILQLVAEGLTSKDIASRLNLSKRTVDIHRSNLMDKLGIRSIANLTKFALKHGLTTLEI